MTAEKFFNINVPTVKERLSVDYKLCDGVTVSFKFIEKGHKFSFYINETEVMRNQYYSNYSVKCAFLYAKNNIKHFQWLPLADGTYLIPKDLELPDKLNWENISIIE